SRVRVESCGQTSRRNWTSKGRRIEESSQNASAGVGGDRRVLAAPGLLELEEGGAAGIRVFTGRAGISRRVFDFGIGNDGNSGALRLARSSGSFGIGKEGGNTNPRPVLVRFGLFNQVSGSAGVSNFGFRPSA